MKAATISLLVVVGMVAAAVAQVEPEGATASAVCHLSHRQVKQLIATASTPQDHLLLAQYFRWEAGKMREKEQYHLEMAEIYRLHPLPFDSKLPMPMQPIIPGGFQIVRLLVPVPLRFVPKVSRQFKMIL